MSDDEPEKSEKSEDLYQPGVPESQDGFADESPGTSGNEFVAADPEPSAEEIVGPVIAEENEADPLAVSVEESERPLTEEAPESAAVQPEVPAPKPKPKPKEVTRWEVYFPAGKREGRKAVYVASFPPIIYFWPAMLTFWLCGFLQSFQFVEPGTLGWFTIVVFALNVLVTVQDFDQKKFLILVLALTVFGLLAWIVNIKEYQFLKNFVQWLIDLSPTLNTPAYVIFGVIFAGLMGWGLMRPMFDYWRLEHNEFVHYIQPFGRDMSIPRAGSTVTKQIPDILEFILTCGGGSLVIKREGRTWAVIPHIPFLSWRMKAIEKLLSETRVTTMDED